MPPLTVASLPSLCVCGGVGRMRLVRWGDVLIPDGMPALTVGCPHCAGVPAVHVRWRDDALRGAA